MKDFNKAYSAFEMALNIKAPWYIADYELDQKNEGLHIYLDFHRGASFTCPHCGQPHARAYDLVDEDRIWRHLDFWQYPTYLHARVSTGRM
ncbi:transposase family protein [Terrilactibacillus sp. S3-3]|nr:transposase family protein [Terrilactibacillus sp. S3-3]